MRFLLAILLFATAALMAAPALAVEPGEMLDDPVLESRARDISTNLRCLVCQNQSIDESDAGLARDLRLIVRERLVAGDDNQAVIDYVVARYGDFVLLKPPFKASTYVLWVSPALVGGLGVLAVFVFYRRRATENAPPPLSEEEKRRLKTLIEDESG